MCSTRRKSGLIGFRWPAICLTLIAIQPAMADEILVQSEDGDPVGAGQDFYYSSSSGSFTLSRNAANGISIDYLGLDSAVARVELAGPNLTALAVGSYSDAERYLAANDVPTPGLGVQLDNGYECSQVSGSFEIHELVYLPDDSVGSLAVDIEQFCDDSRRRLSAQLRFNTTLPAGPVGVIADAGTDLIALPNTSVQLDGSLSSATDSEPFDFSWQQISGPSVTLDDAGIENPSFTAPDTPGREYEFLHFRLTTTDALMRESSDEVIVTISETATPATALQIDARGYLGLNIDKTINQTPTNLFSFVRTDDNGIRLDLVENLGAIPGETRSVLELSAAFEQEPAAGNYEYTLGKLRKPDNFSGLDFSYDLLGSSAPLGRFTLLEVVYRENGAIDRLALNFEISDTDPLNPNLPIDPLLGYLRYNSVVPLISRVPIASAGYDRIFLAEESLAQLDARKTLDQNPQSLIYSWSQISGPTITLDDFDTATPSFLPPEDLLTDEGRFEFELAVTNASGYSDTDRVEITVLGADDPRTYLYLRGALANGGTPDGPSTEVLAKLDKHSFTFADIDPLSSLYDNGISITTQGNLTYKLIVGARNMRQLQAGSYRDTGALPGDFNAVLAAAVASTHCDSGGAFTLHELAYSGSGEIERIAVDFFQRCPIDPLYGALRINSLVPFNPEIPSAAPGSGFLASPGETITLDASASWDIDGEITAYEWLQTSGSPVLLVDGDMSIASAEIQDDPTLLQPLEFQLTVTDDAGNQHSEQIQIEVILPGTVFTGLLLFGEEQDRGFSGLPAYRHDDRVAFAINTDTLDHLVVEAGDLDLEFRARNGAQLEPGNYEGALSTASGIDLFAGLSVHGLPDCDVSSGRFVILEIIRDGLDQIQQLAVDFEQDCGDNGDRFYGALRFNTAVPFRNPTPNAAAGEDIIASEGEFILLDGKNSRDADGSIILSAWRQLSGPVAVMEYIDEQRSRFQVPAGSAGNNLVFEYQVEDEDGNIGTDEISIEIRQLRNRAIIVRKADNEFESIDLSEQRMVATAERTGSTDILHFTGKDEFSFSLTRHGQSQLAAGLYSIDNRFLPATNSIGFSVFGPGGDYQQAFACIARDDFNERNREGWIEIRDVTYGPGNLIETLSFDFEVFCNQNFFWGSVQVDSDSYRPVEVPIADSGNSRTAREGTLVTLSAAASTIPFGLIQRYRWQQLTGVRAVLSNTDEILTTAALPEIGPSFNPFIEFELVVTGEAGFSDRDILSIRILDRSATAAAAETNNGASSGSSGGSSGGGSLSPHWLFILLLTQLLRRRP